MTPRFGPAVKYYFLNALQTQLIITIVAMPILVAWGLGTSLATFIGNIIFTPLLGVFLMLSSMLFFTELLGIPNEMLVSLLEQLTITWDSILSYGQPSWLFTCAHPGTFPLFVSTLIALWCIQHRALTSPTKKIICMTVIVVTMGSSLWLFSKYRQHTMRNSSITFKREGKTNNKHDGLTCAIFDGHRCIVDHGYFARKKSADHSILFELKPYLITTIGAADIDTLIITKPSLASFQAATALCCYCGVKHLFIAYTKAPVSNHAWKVFYDLARFAQTHKITLQRFSLTPYELIAFDAIALAKKYCSLGEKETHTPREQSGYQDHAALPSDEVIELY